MTIIITDARIVFSGCLLSPEMLGNRCKYSRERCSVKD